MTAFQIIVLIAILIILFKAGKRFFKKEISFLLFLIWAIVWLGVGAITVFPVIIENAAVYLGIGRGVDLVTYVSIIVIFYVLFKIIIKQNKLEKNITEMVRNIAVNNKKRKYE